MKAAVITYPQSFSGPPLPLKVKDGTEKPLVSYFKTL